MQAMPEKVPKKANVKYLVRLAFLIALLVVLSFTPIGYLKIGPIAISFLCIPIILGAVLLGPLASTILGLVFGISSFIIAFSDPIGTALLAVNSFAVALSLIVPRVLMGLFTGLIFKAFYSIKKTRAASHIIASAAASLLNTVLYTAFIWLLFSDYFQSIGFASLWLFISTVIGFNGFVELLACGVIGLIVGRIALSVERRAEKNSQPFTAPVVVQDAFTPIESPKQNLPEDISNEF